MKLLGLFLVCLYAAQIFGEEEEEKKCGEKLTTALTDACKNGYIGLPLNKRAVHPRFTQHAIESNERLPYFSNSLADIFEIEEESLEENLRRTRKAGIVEYCCKKPCTVTQLGYYCK